MNITIQNLDKSIGYHVCGDWFVKTARVIAGYYIWDIENYATMEVRRVVLNRNVESDNRLRFVHTGEHAHVQSGIGRTTLGQMHLVMHKLADELYWGETIYKLQN